MVDSFNGFLDDHRGSVKQSVLSKADFSLSVQTGENSNLILTTYPDQGSAASNLLDRQEWFSSIGHLIAESFYYQGDVKTILRGGREDLLRDNKKKMSYVQSWIT